VKRELNVQMTALLMVAVPILPAATVTGLVYVPAKPTYNVELLLPLESPITIVPAPKLLVPVVPRTQPFFIVRLPVNVLTPVKVNDEVELFWTTPVTLVPMTELIVVAPEPAPELVIVPVLLTDTVERVMMPIPVAFNVIFPILVPVTPPLKVRFEAAGDNTRS